MGHARAGHPRVVVRIDCHHARKLRWYETHQWLYEVQISHLDRSSAYGNSGTAIVPNALKLLKRKDGSEPSLGTDWDVSYTARLVELQVDRTS